MEQENRKSGLSAIILRGNHKSSKTNLNSKALGKSMGKKVDHGWYLPFGVYLVLHINNLGVVPLGVVEHFSINEKVGRYTDRLVIHY